MNTGPRLGTLLLLGTTALSGFAAWGGQKFLVERHQPLTPDQSAAQLWTTYRWAIDPQQRREAALLMAAQTGSYDALRSQAWGTSPLGAVVLELEAETATRRGDQSLALQDVVGARLCSHQQGGFSALLGIDRPAVGRPELRCRLIWR